MQYELVIQGVIDWDGKEGEYVNIGACHNTWYVGCPYPFFEGHVKYCGIHPAAKWYADLEEAERQWNKRVDLEEEEG